MDRLFHRLLCGLLLLSLTLVVAGCGYFAPWSTEERAREQLQDYLADAGEPASLWGDVWMEAERGGERAAFPAELIIAYPDRFRLTVFGLFDRPLAYLTSDGEEMNLYLVENSRFYSGPADEYALAHVLGLPPLPPAEVLAYLGGRLPVGPKAVAEGNATLNKDRRHPAWVVNLGRMAGEERILLAPDGRFPREYSRLLPGNARLRVDLDDYTRVKDGEGYYPRRVRIATETDDVILKVKYRDREPGVATEHKLFTLDPPAGAMRLPLGAAGWLLAPLPRLERPERPQTPELPSD